MAADDAIQIDGTLWGSCPRARPDVEDESETLENADHVCQFCTRLSGFELIDPLSRDARARGEVGLREAELYATASYGRSDVADRTRLQSLLHDWYVASATVRCHAAKATDRCQESNATAGYQRRCLTTPPRSTVDRWPSRARGSARCAPWSPRARAAPARTRCSTRRT